MAGVGHDIFSMSSSSIVALRVRVLVDAAISCVMSRNISGATAHVLGAFCPNRPCVFLALTYARCSAARCCCSPRTLRSQSRRYSFLIDGTGSHTMVRPPDHAQASTAGRLPSSVTVDRVADIPGGRYHTQRPSVGGGQHEVSEKRIISAIDCMLGWKLISTRFLARFLTNQGLIDALGVGIDHGKRGGGSICPG